MQSLRGVALRRAVLGVLLAANGARSVREIVDALHAEGVTTSPTLVSDPIRVVADLLAYQRTLGRVRRVGFGRYEAVPSMMSPAMRSRCRHWRRALRPPPPDGDLPLPP